jgi:hypothetical protein
MIAIRNYTTLSGWKPYAFEPANEPNTEWWTLAELTNSPTWTSMDMYFKNLWSEAHAGGANSDIRVLAAPMSQSAYAEALNIVDCSAYDTLINGRSGGLNWMEYSWKESIQLPDGSFVNYNDGWSWHNYWQYGEEGANVDNSCTANSGHNFQALPADLKLKILNSSDFAFITEADVYSPCIGEALQLFEKGEAGYSDRGARAGDAMKVFIRQERGADYVAGWALTIAYSDSTLCNARGTNDEFAWHEAFRSNPATERYWFNYWWFFGLDP